MSLIYLAEIVAATDSAGTTTTLRYATGAYNTAPADSPANTHYAPRLIQPALMRRELFGGGSIGGRTRSSVGELVLDNSDGALDALIDYSFGERSLVIKVGEQTAALSTFTTILSGTCEQVDFTSSHAILRLKDKMAELEKPFLQTLYDGDNVLPAGVEGTSELAGKAKPWLVGFTRNVEPICVNTSKLIYQVSRYAILSSPSALQDQGASLTQGSDYTSQADMEATAPSSGQYRIWPAGGMLRLGATPLGRLTGNFFSDYPSGAYADFDDNLLNLLSEAGITDYNASELAALHSIASSVTPICLWLTSRDRTVDVLDSIFATWGAYWGFDATGELRMKQLAAPSGTPAASFTTSDILRLERVTARDVTRGIPVWRVRVHYNRNWAVMVDGFAGSVAMSSRADFAREWYTVTAEDSAVKTQYANAVEYDAFMTINNSVIKAQAEADRLLALLKVKRDTFEATVHLDKDAVTSVDLGEVVQLTHPRWGMSGGKLFRVVAIEHDFRAEKALLTLWG